MNDSLLVEDTMQSLPAWILLLQKIVMRDKCDSLKKCKNCFSLKWEVIYIFDKNDYLHLMDFQIFLLVLLQILFLIHAQIWMYHLDLIVFHFQWGDF